MNKSIYTLLVARMQARAAIMGTEASEKVLVHSVYKDIVNQVELYWDDQNGSTHMEVEQLPKR